MKVQRLIITLAVVLLSVLLWAACTSQPTIIPEDLTAADLIQEAQNAAEKSNYKAALDYYQAVLKRFPSNMTVVCAAEYEIAFIHYKQNNFDEAETRFEALLERYKGPDGALLPTEFKVLSDKLLSQIRLKT